MLELKHILTPIDGFSHTRQGRQGRNRIRQAGRRQGHCLLRRQPGALCLFAEGAPADETAMVALERCARHAGEKHVEAIAKAARSAGVSCQSAVEIAVPDEGTSVAARKRKCDAMFMGSHGRPGLKRLLLGSVTSRVLASADRPVIVYR